MIAGWRVQADARKRYAAEMAAFEVMRKHWAIGLLEVEQWELAQIHLDLAQIHLDLAQIHLDLAQIHRVWMVSGSCLDGVWIVSGSCQDLSIARWSLPPSAHVVGHALYAVGHLLSAGQRAGYPQISPVLGPGLGAL